MHRLHCIGASWQTRCPALAAWRFGRTARDSADGEVFVSGGAVVFFSPCSLRSHDDGVPRRTPRRSSARSAVAAASYTPPRRSPPGREMPATMRQLPWSTLPGSASSACGSSRAATARTSSRPLRVALYTQGIEGAVRVRVLLDHLLLVALGLPSSPHPRAGRLPPPPRCRRRGGPAGTSTSSRQVRALLSMVGGHRLGSILRCRTRFFPLPSPTRMGVYWRTLTSSPRSWVLASSH